MEARDLFNEIINFFNAAYPRRGVHMKGTLVYVDGDCKFNTDGFNLLYNLKRLCEALEDELI